MSAGIKTIILHLTAAIKMRQELFLPHAADDPHWPKAEGVHQYNDCCSFAHYGLSFTAFLYVELLNLQERKALMKQSLLHCFTLPSGDLWLSNVPLAQRWCFSCTEDEDTLISCSAANMTEKKTVIKKQKNNSTFLSGGRGPACKMSHAPERCLSMCWEVYISSIKSQTEFPGRAADGAASINI